MGSTPEEEQKSDSAGLKCYDHPVWKNRKYVDLLAALAIHACRTLHPTKPFVVTSLYRAVVAYAGDLKDETFVNAQLEREDRVIENFRRFLNKSDGQFEETVFLNYLYRFLTDTGPAGFSPQLQSDKYIHFRNRLLNVTDLPSTFDRFLSDEEISTSYSDFEAPLRTDVLRIAKEYFGVEEEGFKRASSQLTGYREAESGGLEEKAFFACYRLSGNLDQTNNEPALVKTRLVIFPPDGKYPYCRFHNYTDEEQGGFNRDAVGVVLPVNQKYYYLIGSVKGDPSPAAKIFCLRGIESFPKGLQTSGLIMSSDLVDSLPLTSSIFVVREDRDQVVNSPTDEAAASGNQYVPKRDDLGEIPIDDDLVNNFRYGLAFKETDNRTLEDYVTSAFDTMLDHIQNFPQHVLDEFPEEHRKQIQVAIKLMRRPRKASKQTAPDPA